MSQRLIPKKGGGRIAVCEILRSNSRTKEYVQEGEREGKEPAVDAMDDGRARGHADLRPASWSGSSTPARSTARLALSYATNRTNLQLKLDTQAAPRPRIAEVIALKPQIGDMRRTGSFRPRTRRGLRDRRARRPRRRRTTPRWKT